ncbi:LysE family translocator [Nonomuraea sp. NPDC050328]|uniref:LysE family translocator n=1 Tax=Nonomuraea sp. NPDC050328 TaxID=3364361 RepID=UPI0037A76896
MTITTALATFAVMVGLLTLTPGLDTALILRTSALGHRRKAVGVVLGIQAGTMVWGILTAAGVTALLTASQLAYDVLRWAGAAYLVWMGARMIVDTLRRRTAEAADAGEVVVAGADSLAAGFRQGALTNLLNPKVGAFYVAVLPNFIPAGAQPLLMGVALAGTHVLLGLVWSSVLVVLARALRAQLARPRARRVLDRLTGTVVAAFGIKLALGDQ